MLTTAATGGSKVVSVISEWRTALSRTFIGSPATPSSSSASATWTSLPSAPRVIRLGTHQHCDDLLHTQNLQSAPGYFTSRTWCWLLINSPMSPANSR